MTVPSNERSRSYSLLSDRTFSIEHSSSLMLPGI
jgi:hypothetical protein